MLEGMRSMAAALAACSSHSSACTDAAAVSDDAHVHHIGYSACWGICRASPPERAYGVVPAARVGKEGTGPLGARHGYVWDVAGTHVTASAINVPPQHSHTHSSIKDTE